MKPLFFRAKPVKPGDDCSLDDIKARTRRIREGKESYKRTKWVEKDGVVSSYTV